MTGRSPSVREVHQEPPPLSGNQTLPTWQMCRPPQHNKAEGHQSGRFTRASQLLSGLTFHRAIEQTALACLGKEAVTRKCTRGSALLQAFPCSILPSRYQALAQEQTAQQTPSTGTGATCVGTQPEAKWHSCSAVKAVTPHPASCWPVTWQLCDCRSVIGSNPSTAEQAAAPHAGLHSAPDQPTGAPSVLCQAHTAAAQAGAAADVALAQSFCLSKLSQQTHMAGLAWSASSEACMSAIKPACAHVADSPA